jgi:uncharacterized glyoxalase superfamily protein PhnB
MDFAVFLHFDGYFRAAIEYYVEVFKLKMPKYLMTFSQNQENPVAKEDKDRIIFAFFYLLMQHNVF